MLGHCGHYQHHYQHHYSVFGKKQDLCTMSYRKVVILIYLKGNCVFQIPWQKPSKSSSTASKCSWTCFFSDSSQRSCKFIYLFIFYFFVFCLFRATPSAYGAFQARGLIGTIAAGLHHSCSNARYEPHLRSTRQLITTPDA